MTHLALTSAIKCSGTGSNKVRSQVSVTCLRSANNVVYERVSQIKVSVTKIKQILIPLSPIKQLIAKTVSISKHTCIYEYIHINRHSIFLLCY